MTVQELGLLHRRYVDLSAVFRSVWAFHQFLQGLEKVFAEAETLVEPGTFEGLQDRLKEISKHLNAAETDHLRASLDEIEERLEELMAGLLERDGQVSPQSLRLFFQRVKRTDAKILGQLVRFYVFSHEGGEWENDRLDKVDFLLGRLSSALRKELGPGAVGHRERLREIFEALWRALEVPAPDEHEVEVNRQTIEAIRSEVDRVTDLDQLNEQRVVKRYRELKHSLGSLFFHPDLLFAIVETNRVLGERLREFYGAEERRIVHDYRQMFETEPALPADVDGELTQVHQQVAELERNLEGGETKVEEVGDLLRRVNSLLSALQDSSPRWQQVFQALSAAQGDVAEGGRLETEPVAASEAAPPLTDGLILSHWERMMAALGQTDAELPPKSVCLDPEVFPFRLEPREITAYRQLQGDDGGFAAAPFRERLLLEAAALRARLREDAEQMRALADSNSDAGDEAFSRSRELLRLADGYVRRFDQLVEEAVVDGELAEAQLLQVSRMRLWRDYADLWLLTCKPALLGEPLQPED